MKKHFFTLVVLLLLYGGAYATKSTTFFMNNKKDTVHACTFIDAVSFKHKTVPVVSGNFSDIYAVGDSNATYSLSLGISPTGAQSWTNLSSSIPDGSYYVISYDGVTYDTSNIITIITHDGNFNAGALVINSNPSPHQCFGGILHVSHSVLPTIPANAPAYHLYWFYNPSFGSNIPLSTWTDSLSGDYTAVSPTQHTFICKIVYDTTACLSHATSFSANKTSQSVIGMQQFTVGGGGTIFTFGGSVAITVSGNQGGGVSYYIYKNGIFDTIRQTVWPYFLVQDSGVYTIKGYMPNPPNPDSCIIPLLGSATVKINIPIVLAIDSTNKYPIINGTPAYMFKDCVIGVTGSFTVESPDPGLIQVYNTLGQIVGSYSFPEGKSIIRIDGAKGFNAACIQRTTPSLDSKLGEDKRFTFFNLVPE